jgi:hypothetical protein
MPRRSTVIAAGNLSAMPLKLATGAAALPWLRRFATLDVAEGILPLGEKRRVAVSASLDGFLPSGGRCSGWPSLIRFFDVAYAAASDDALRRQLSRF